MDNRFGFRDLVLVGLLVALGVMTFLAMQQDDRQLEVMQKLNNRLDTQTKNLTQLRRQLSDKLEDLTEAQKQATKAKPQADDGADQPQPSDAEADDAATGEGQASDEGAPGSADESTTDQDNASKDAAPDESANAAPSPAERAKRQSFPEPGEVDGEIKVFAKGRPNLQAIRARADFAQGGRLVDSFSTKVENLTPFIGGSLYASNVQDLVLERLGTLDLDTLKYRGQLARRWVIEKNVAPYRRWREEKEAALKKKLEGPDKPETYTKQLEALLKQATGGRPERGSARYQRYVDRARQDWIDKQVKQDKSKPIPITIHFELRRGLQFADGEALTASDLAFTFDWIMNPKVAAPRQRAYFQKIQDVEAVTPRYVRVTFTEPYFEALNLAASLPALPEHYYGSMDPRDYNNSKARLLGSGPYTMRDREVWRPGEPIVLQRNHRYWGPSPGFNEIVYMQYTNSTAELTTFRNGQLDVFSAEPEQYDALLKDDELTARTRHYEYMTPFNGYRYIAWNQRTADGEKTRFADKRVRQAMTMLIDRKAILNRVLMGYGQIATGPFNPLGEQPAPDLEPWPHDVKRAKALLKEAGYWDRDGDRTIEGPDGEPFRFEFTYPAGSPSYKKMAFHLANAFSYAGIQMELNPLEFNMLIQRYKRKQFDAISLGWSSGPETDIFQMFHSSQMIAEGDNASSYRNPRLDRLMEQARTTIDRDKRMDLWHECHRILHEDQPYTFLFWGKSLRFVDKRLHNTELRRAGMNPPWLWYVPDTTQARHTQ